MNLVERKLSGRASSSKLGHMLWGFLHYIFSLNPLLTLNNGKGMVYTVIIYNFPPMTHASLSVGEGGLWSTAFAAGQDGRARKACGL